MPTVLVLLAEGFEEIETATVIDVLRRADVEVSVIGLRGPGPTLGSRRLAFVAEAGLDDAAPEADLIVLPGGAKGAEALAADVRVRSLVRRQVDAGRPVAAICAAPFALDQAGVLAAGNFTCYPGWESRLETKGRRHEPVVETETVITSQGPGTAMDFALSLVGRLCGKARAVEVARALLVPAPA